MKRTLATTGSGCNQKGMVSILVTMIMMIVISLIVLGFGQIARREEREVLDQQLTTEAFLAAESGVNEAANAIRAFIATAGSSAAVPAKTQCAPDTDSSSPYTESKMDPVLLKDGDGKPTVSTSCLLVSTALDDIRQDVASDGTTATVPLHPASGSIRSLTFNWTQPNKITNSDLNNCPASIPANTPPNGSLPQGASWHCPYSILRVDLVPTSATTGANILNRDALLANQVTFFLYPTTGAAGTIDYAGAKGGISAMHCTLVQCSATLTNMSTNYADYGMRLGAVYASGGTADVTASDAPGGGGAPITLKDAQALIDSTGKAQDVLRRVQARIQLTSSTDFGTAVLASGSSICKRFGIGNGQFDISDIKGQDTNNPLCKTLVVNPTPPPNPNIACTLRGGNMIQNGDFKKTKGMPDKLTNQAWYGFTSDVPNRGPNIFPDDEGNNGVYPNWAGGFSAVDQPGYYNNGAVHILPFTGDPTVNPAVEGNANMLYFNPNQSIKEQPNTNHDPSPADQGPIWQVELNNLTVGQKYDFSGYFANPLSNSYMQSFYDNYDVAPFVPIIQFTINGSLTDTPITFDQPESAWKRVTLTFTATQKTAVFAVHDIQTQVGGGDLLMTSVGIYPCLK